MIHNEPPFQSTSHPFFITGTFWLNTFYSEIAPIYLIPICAPILYIVGEAKLGSFIIPSQNPPQHPVSCLLTVYKDKVEQVQLRIFSVP